MADSPPTDLVIGQLPGLWPYTRAVVIRFPDETEARRWYESPEYQALAQHRWRASTGTVVAFEGFC